MGKTPTIGELWALYHRIAALERLKCDRPSRWTVYNVGSAINKLLEVTDLTLDSPFTEITRQRLNNFMLECLARKFSAASTTCYLQRLCALTTRWTMPYYEDQGWEVKPICLPVFRKRLMRYHRPSRELLGKVKEWFEGLREREDRRYRMVVMLMLEFAMRNGDIMRLRAENFIVRGERTFLMYTPHKTAFSSGRTVCWPVHPDLLAEITAFKFPIRWPQKIFAELNAELRGLGFKGAKGLYELRKICIDHIYQGFGAEAASSISGDDIRTVTRYYADPSAVSINDVRVVDLL